MGELIAQGAEAKIFKFSIDNKTYIAKERISKSYRIKELDNKIRRYRTRREINSLKRCIKIIPVPKVHNASSESGERIVMDFIEGKKLVDHLDLLNNKKRLVICKTIGKQTAILHNNNIIHGDLTTSNMILKNKKLYFIDFGLSFIDQKIEHKAVDLHLLKQALESKHYKHYESSFKAVLNSYKKYCNNSKEVLSRLDQVEGRGRYKSKNKTNFMQ